MKTRNILFVFSVAAMTLSSCSKDGNLDNESQSGLVALTLETDCAEVITRATEPGEDAYNENKIVSIHWYFFDDSDVLILGGTKTVNKTASATIYLSDLTESQFNTIFAGTRTEVKTVVVANATVPNGTAGTTTLDDIKAAAAPELTTHESQASFAMYGEGILTKGTPATGTISLKRTAAKFRIHVKINNRYVNPKDLSVWKPETAALLMTFNNLEPKGYIASGDAQSATLNKVDSVGIDNTADNYFKKTNDGDEINPQEWTLTVPVYSYPRTWVPQDTDYPYLYFTLSWTKEDNSLTEKTYYKVLFPTSSFDSNNLYDITVMLDGLGSLVPEQTVTIDDMTLTVEGKWKDAIDDADKHDTDVNMAMPHVLAVNSNTYTIYNQDEIYIPFVTSHECLWKNPTSTERTTYSLPANQNSRSSTLASSDTTFKLTDAYGEIYFKHTLKNMPASGTDYDYQEFVFTFKLYHKSDPNVFEFITIRQRPSICIEQETPVSQNSYIFIHGEGLTSNGSATDHGDHSYRILKTSSGVNATAAQRITAGVLPSDGPISDFMIGDPRDRSNAITDFSSILSGAVVKDGNKTKYYVGTGYSGSVSYTGTFSFGVPSYVSSNPSFKHIDGTTPSPNDVHTYYRSTSSTKYIIAPEFIITSGYPGVDNHLMNVDAATLRCAAYQEIGYPAGRWRLPTMAELGYAARLQNDSKIKKLLNTSAPYVAADGIYNISGTAISSSSESYGSVRCVYDSWYWDQVDKNHFYTTGTNSGKSWYETRSSRYSTYTYGDMAIE